MAQPQQNVSLTAPGFAGLNTQDSPLDMDHQFASVANNCVIDRFGRIASRRGFRYLTTNPTVLNDNPITALEEFITSDRQSWLLCAGNSKLWVQQEIAPFELVELTLPLGYVITADNWQFVPFNDLCYIVQAGHEPLVFDPADPTSVRVMDAATYPTNIFALNGFPNTAHAGYGRLWFGDFDTNSTLVGWSGLLNGENWDNLGWGTLQTEEYWPSGFDEVRALAAHNNFMCIFGEFNILVYSTTSDVVSTLRLQDTIEGIGCIARDSVVPTGTDFMFIDATGVRSLNRTIQEKSVPIGDISMNVRVEFQFALKNEPEDDIKAVYHVEDSFYACFLPSNPKTYVFDTWSPLPTGAARATVWTDLRPRCGTRTIDRITYFGGNGGVYTYVDGVDQFLDPDNAYTPTVATIPMAYFTHPLDFGSAAHLIFPKQVDVTVIGGSSGEMFLNWAYDYSENFANKSLPLNALGKVALWDSGFEWSDPDLEPGTVGNFGEWTAEQQNITQLKYNIWGSGRNVKVGFTADVSGSVVSIQELNIQALQGRLL